MQTSEKGIAFIKGCEGFAAHPYMDTNRIAWGYGHNQQAGEVIPSSVTLEEADALLRRDLRLRYEPVVNALIPANCTQGQFDALVSFCFNLGKEPLETMLAHGWADVPNQIPRWNKSGGVPTKGLTARRALEVKLFTS